ncbi:unnamed protein product, partial [Gongylonema pulchrum]|uniref:Protein-tyrosine phosphatase n=1 Tax=Gongylonema pulchrum TaxID=637853 RepID=A0A183DWU4_9BILA
WIHFSEERHIVQHYKWSSWPDRSAPINPSPLIELITKLRPLHEKGPVAVHCSAGIGRTGTFCAVDYSIDRLNDEGIINAPEVVKEVRAQRLHSVQSVLQYLFLHLCLIEYLVSAKTLQRDHLVKKFQRDYEKYLKKFNERLAKEK